MTEEPPESPLAAGLPSARLQAALAAGTRPETTSVEALLERSAVEPDFFVRDMLVWALTRQPVDTVVPRLITELRSPVPQARSQALHTLSKVRDGRAWPFVSGDLLHDSDQEVARSAWRAAVVLVPAGGEAALATELARELGRGDLDLQRSLSRALLALGDASEAALSAASAEGTDAVRAHAEATKRLLLDPDSSFASAIEDAKRAAILGRGPIPGSDG